MCKYESLFFIYPADGAVVEPVAPQAVEVGGSLAEEQTLVGVFLLENKIQELYHGKSVPRRCVSVDGVHDSALRKTGVPV